ncbi:MAG: heavy-metal-associated domain-containing protein [Spirochaetaceae bacterium]|nr:MAG: heavy-metal-associated domain-containing protein [Spirochaetaceae bacterium]
MLTDNYGTKTMDLYIEGMHCERCVRKLSMALSQIEGVESCDVEMGHARISYLPQLATPQALKRTAESTGYEAHLQAPRKGPWQRFLDRMIRSNEGVFGNKRPDCCSIISDQQTRKQN